MEKIFNFQPQCFCLKQSKIEVLCFCTIPPIVFLFGYVKISAQERKDLERKASFAPEDVQRYDERKANGGRTKNALYKTKGRHRENTVSSFFVRLCLNKAAPYCKISNL